MNVKQPPDYSVKVLKVLTNKKRVCDMEEEGMKILSTKRVSTKTSRLLSLIWTGWRREGREKWRLGRRL